MIGIAPQRHCEGLHLREGTWERIVESGATCGLAVTQ